MQRGQRLRRALVEGGQEAAQGGLTGYGFDAEHCGHGRVSLQPGDAREFVSAGQEATEQPQGDVGRGERVGAGRSVRQGLFELAAELLLVQELRPHAESAVGGEALIGEADSDGRTAVVSVNVQAHRLVCLRARRRSEVCGHTTKPTKRCSHFQLNRSGLEEAAADSSQNSLKFHTAQSLLLR